MAGATEVLVGSAQPLGADARAARRAGARRSTRCCSRLSPVDLVLVEGFKREPHPKLEVYRAAVGKPLLHPDDPRDRRRSRRTRPLPAARVPVVDLDDVDGIADILLRHAAAASMPSLGACGSQRLMAQLTDDCFAFSGPLLPVDEVERIIAERVAPVAETETVALSAARGRVLARDVVAPIDLPPFDNSAVDGYAVRHADLAAERRDAAARSSSA